MSLIPMIYLVAFSHVEGNSKLLFTDIALGRISMLFYVTAESYKVLLGMCFEMCRGNIYIL